MARILLIILTLLMHGCNSNSQTNKSVKIDELVELASISDSLLDLTTSVKYYTEILELDSTKLIALNNRGRAYVWLNQQDKGFADFDKAVELYPHERTYYTRGMAYININRYNKALPDLMRSIALNPKFGESYYGLSLIKMNQGDLDSALFFCGKADNLSYLPGLSHQIRFSIFKEKGDFKSAIDELTESIKLDPNPDNYNNRGLAKNQLKQYKDAIIDFDLAIKLEPKMAFAYNNKAFALLKLEQFDHALTTVNTSLELNSKNAYAFKNRGVIFIALGSMDKACIDLTEADKLSTDSALAAEIKLLTDRICKK
jgi:tetratricopeptide (TPR) repeat protein